MLRLTRNGVFLPIRFSSSIKITDENGVEVVSNWPKVFGPGIYKNGKRAGLPIIEDKWQTGNYLNKGRAATYETQHKWPKQNQFMPLKMKLEKPLEDDSFKYFKNESNLDFFPTPSGEIPKIDEIYRTENPKEIIIEGIPNENSDNSENNSEKNQTVEAATRECPLDSRFISVSPKDVLILSQFMNKDGSIRTQKQTGLSDRQYVVVLEAINIAQNDGLLPLQRYSYYENRSRWRIQLVDNLKEKRYHFGQPASYEIMNRHNSNSPPGSRRALYSSGLPFFRTYVNVGSEILAEETPFGLPRPRTQRESTSKCLRLIRPSDTDSYPDYHGTIKKKYRRGPFNHCA
jgi:ribosomal protein S18